jgi:hypothetical protein
MRKIKAIGSTVNVFRDVTDDRGSLRAYTAEEWVGFEPDGILQIQ